MERKPNNYIYFFLFFDIIKDDNKEKTDWYSRKSTSIVNDKIKSTKIKAQSSPFTAKSFKKPPKNDSN